MKTQQRSFVVEIKGARRRAKTQSRSIWGDTDFKALAREDDAAHIFKPGTSETFSEPHDLRAEIIEAVTVENDVSQQSEISQFESDQEQSPQQEQDQFVAPVSPATVATSAEPVRKAAKRQKTLKPTEQRRLSQIATREAAQVAPSRDELALLEAENERLKALRQAQLVKENTRLRKMLARFPGE